MAFKPDYLTIEDTCEVLGCKPRHVLDLVAALRLRCGVISPGWDGLAMPPPSKYATNNWTDGLVEFDGTHLLANQREGVSFRVKESHVIGFWFLDDGDAMDLAISKDGTTEATWLWPEDGAIWHKKNPECFPWPEFLYCVEKQQEKSRQIVINDLRFHRVDVEAFVAVEIIERSGEGCGAPTAGSEAPGPWRTLEDLLEREIDNIEKAHPGHGICVPAIHYLKNLGDPRIPNQGKRIELWWIPENCEKARLVGTKTVSSLISRVRAKRKSLS